MSNVKISSNQYLGSLELNRIVQFLSDDGFKKTFLENSSTFGVFQKDGSAFENFLVTQGANIGTIKHTDGIAIDSQANIIVKPAEDNIAIPDDNTPRLLRIRHTFSSEEEGTVSISADGTVTGVGTKFTESLRGLPGKYVSKLKFNNSVSNTSEYFVAEVVDDTTILLQGELIAEVDLTYSVIGTFDPNFSISAADKEVFQFDSCELDLVLESNVLVQGQEFYIARVTNDGGNLTIQDLRSRYLYKSSYQAKKETIDFGENPLIGVESVKFNNPASARDQNIVRVGWGMRSSNWSYNPSLNRVTINAGEGGGYTSTADFQDNDFDGWRLYVSSSEYYRVKSSFKQGAQININLETSDYEKFTPGTEISVVPNSDNILLRFSANPDDNFPNAEQRFMFPIRDGFADVQVLVYQDVSSYIVKYQYRSVDVYSQELLIPSFTVGYLSEVSFNGDGTLRPAVDRVRVPYNSSETTGFITLNASATSYSKVVEQFVLGDLSGVNRTELDNLTPTRSLFVGTSKLYQVFEGSITLTVDHFIDLRPDDARESNEFILIFDQSIDLSGFTIRITQGFVNPGDIGNELFAFDDFWTTRANEQNLTIRCIFDGTNWIVKPDASAFAQTVAAALLPDGSINATGVLSYDSDQIFTANSNQIPSIKEVETKDNAVIATIRQSVPASLNDLEKIGDALGNDPDFSTNIANDITSVQAIANSKIGISDLLDSFVSNSTSAPPTANALGDVHARTNLSDLHVINDATVDFGAVSTVSDKQYAPVTISAAGLGSSAYSYAAFVVGQFRFDADSSADDLVDCRIEISTNGGSTYTTLVEQNRASDNDKDWIDVVLFGKVTVPAGGSILARLRGVVTAGGNTRFSNDSQLQAFAINAFE